MKDLLEKISSYNIFNYLLPGVIFAALIDATTSFKLLQPDIVIGVFIYYFLGSIVSRVGSIAIDPALKKVGFIKFSEYSDFIAAEKADPKIGILSEVNNMYRTFLSLLILIVAVKIYDHVASTSEFLTAISPYVLVLSLLILYLASYKKQTAYIVKRVESVCKEKQ